MGSFLMKCGMTSRVLKEGTPVHLFFLAYPLLCREGKIAEWDAFGNAKAENIHLKGVQDDYGYVEVDEKYKEEMVLLMTALASHSAEEPSSNEYHPSWKQYFTKNMKNIDKMSFDDISEHFNQLIVILHNKGIAYKSSIQGTVSVMKVSHVDSLAIDVLKNTPIEIDAWGLKYKGESDYSRCILNNFDDFMRYFIISRGDKWKKSIGNSFSDIHRYQVGSEANYHALLNENYPEDEDRKDVNSIINFVLTRNETNLLLSYMSYAGISLAASDYAGQDYQEIASRNYRTVMSRIFTAQKENLLEKRINDAAENGENLNGEELAQELFDNEKLYEKYKKEAYLEHLDKDEVIVNPKTLLITEDVDGLEIMHDFQKFQEELLSDNNVENQGKKMNP